MCQPVNVKVKVCQFDNAESHSSSEGKKSRDVYCVVEDLSLDDPEIELYLQHLKTVLYRVKVL